MSTHQNNCPLLNQGSKLSIILTLLLFLFGSFIHSASAQVAVSVGYLNNLTGQPPSEETPFPFDTDSTNLLISSGGVSDTHDSGVILIENLTELPVTIDRGLRVTTEAREVQNLPALFQIWDDSLPIVLPPNQSLVFAETVFPNFDTSDVRDFTVDNPPMLKGSVNGRPFLFTDQDFVLLGRGDIGNSDETTPYQQLGVFQSSDFIGGTVIGLGAAQAECHNLNTGQVVDGSITNGTLNCAALGLKSTPNDNLVLSLRGVAQSGGDLPRIIAEDKRTVRCLNGADFVIKTGEKNGKCTIVVGTNGHDQSGSCTGADGKTTNTGVDCSRNGGKGGCDAKNDATGGSCTLAAH